MSERIAAFGTQLQIGDGGGPENFTTIAGVRDISGPTLSAENVDAMAHDSAGAWRDKVATFLDGGDVTFDIAYDPAEATHKDGTGGLLEDMKNRVLRNFQLVFPDAAATTWAFSAFVTGFQPSAPLGDLLTASVTLTLSGQPTLA